MSERDPTRWLESGADASAQMRDALGAARAARPSPEQLAGLAARLTAALGVPVAPPAVPPTAPWWSAPVAKLASVVLLVGGGAVVAAGAATEPDARQHAEAGLEA